MNQILILANKLWFLSLNQDEKKERERNEETLLNLLNETCNKIESVNL